MDHEKMVALLKQGQGTWQKIKDGQSQLGLPISPYSSDFLPSLLLGAMSGNWGEIGQQVKTGAQRLTELKRDSDLFRALMATVDTMAILVLAHLDNMSAVAQNAATPLPIVACPNCGHDFAKCAKGHYEVIEMPSPLEIGKLEPVTTAVIHGCSHFGSDGKCMDCTEDRKIDCSDCDEEVLLAKAHQCKEFDECGYVYCDDCAKDNLSANGYCQDCRIVNCDSCEEDVEKGQERLCANPECKTPWDYCQKCAARRLNNVGLCTDCSSEEELECTDCGEWCTESKIIRCAKNEDCGNAFCHECKKGNLNPSGICLDCQE